jgi:hypothetical protein
MKMEHDDQKLELETDAGFIVTDDERESWMNLSSERLKNAYDSDEIEYSLDLIKSTHRVADI